jgi:hypothetical protein
VENVTTQIVGACSAVFPRIPDCDPWSGRHVRRLGQRMDEGKFRSAPTALAASPKFSDNFFSPLFVHVIEKEKTSKNLMGDFFCFWAMLDFRQNLRHKN